jgi:hypothetical protein
MTDIVNFKLRNEGKDWTKCKGGVSMSLSPRPGKRKNIQPTIRQENLNHNFRIVC